MELLGLLRQKSCAKKLMKHTSWLNTQVDWTHKLIEHTSWLNTQINWTHQLIEHTSWSNTQVDWTHQLIEYTSWLNTVRLVVQRNLWNTQLIEHIITTWSFLFFREQSWMTLNTNERKNMFLSLPPLISLKQAQFKTDVGKINNTFISFSSFPPHILWWWWWWWWWCWWWWRRRQWWWWGGGGETMRDRCGEQ